MFRINPMSQTPVYEQIIEQTERFILMGVLSSGDRIPSVRSLSVTLGLNPNTVQKSYTEMSGRGIIVTAPGRGYFIAEDARHKLSQKGREKIGSFEAMVRELSSYGIDKSELCEIVEKVYKGGSEQQ